MKARPRLRLVPSRKPEPVVPPDVVGAGKLLRAEGYLLRQARAAQRLGLPDLLLFYSRGHLALKLWRVLGEGDPSLSGDGVPETSRRTSAQVIQSVAPEKS